MNSPIPWQSVEPGERRWVPQIGNGHHGLSLTAYRPKETGSLILPFKSVRGYKLALKANSRFESYTPRSI
jgi:hypothetical protein